MKYIDADKIRTEIKRLKAENNCGTDEFIAAKDIAYDKVFDFLENLEEPVTDCHDLEEAAEKYGSEYPAYNNDQFIAESAFKSGAEWQKTKMMKEAVEGEVVKDISNKLAVTAKNINLDGLKFGDKVRIIILPEEEEQ